MPRARPTTTPTHWVVSRGEGVGAPGYQNSNLPIKTYTPIENNDLVLVRNFNAKSFEARWKGPFPVVRHDKHITYHVRENGEIKQYHRSDIKSFIPGDGLSEIDRPDTSPFDTSGSSY